MAAVGGFPLWLAFAWFYKFTPEGLNRESRRRTRHLRRRPSGARALGRILGEGKGGWRLNNLTGLHALNLENLKTLSGAVVQDSPLGKLCATVAPLKTIESSGHFVSNAGCELQLDSGKGADTTKAASAVLLADRASLSRRRRH